MTMSPPPESEPVPHSNLPFQSGRPKALTFLGILGCVLGCCGILCIGGAATFGLIKGDPNMEHAAPMMMIMNLALTFMSVLLSFLLLVASVGLLTLRPWSRTMMIVFAWVDMIYDLAKLIITMFILLPMMMKMFQDNPPQGITPQMIPMIRVATIVQTVLIFIVTTGFAVTALLLLNRPNAKAALASVELPEQPLM